jgi:ketosteroid isomerase-like protein
MATAKENEAQARRSYAAFAAGDLDTVREAFHPDVVWHFSGNTPISRDYKGIDDVLGFFANVFTETNGTFSNELEEVIANDDATVVIGNVSAERNGKKITTKQVAIYKADADGKVTEAFFYGDDTTQFDAFWS